jgi:hypothetical protein
MIRLVELLESPRETPAPTKAKFQQNSFANKPECA